ncbi:hypothetical protein IWQ62_001520 [Dispira parvispora]|uniref:P-type ATPase A domain-containing protein n=1 Tax=Dispira parvispora TaxID=1520584 RepID=A0A9W8E8G3_9FUNG|nr:hypothetical protein IWQ62_001520 [Dispira parvispora]
MLQDCPTNQQLCDDGECHDSCTDVVNVCQCPDGRGFDTGGGLVPCKLLPSVDIDNFVPKNKSLIAIDHCAREYDVSWDTYGIWGDQGKDGVWLKCPKGAQAWYTYSEPMWIGVFSVSGAEIVLLALWALYKQRQERRLKTTQGMAIHSTEDLPLVDVDEKIRLTTEKQEAETANFSSTTPEFDITGYRNHWYGTMVVWSLVPISVGFIVLMSVVIADYYGSLGVPSLTYSDTRLSNHTMIMCWYASTFWFLALNITRFRLRNFFRIKCAPQDGNVVQIERYVEPTILSGTKSILLKLVRRLEQRCKKFFGWDVYVRTERMHYTQQGRCYFNFQCTRYLFDESTLSFSPHEFHLGDTNLRILDQAGGLSSEEALHRLELLGANFISVVVPNFFLAMAQEFMSFFYLYQMLILWLFYYNVYYQIGLVDTGLVILSALIRVIIRLKSEKELKAMAEQNIDCQVLRDGEWVKLSSRDLVPGDVIQIVKDMPLPCDAIVISGNTIVDESSLTGESLPIRKCALDNTHEQPFAMETCKINMLFAGTKVSDVTPAPTSEYVQAVVSRTGTATDKGELVRKILFPNPVSFIFDEQLKIVLCILSLYGVLLFAIGLWWMRNNLEAAWFYAMFAMAQLVSPILPAALVIGQSIASVRLRHKKIFCVDLPRIMIAGKVQIFCFDKTGTLTKEGLEFHGAQAISSQEKVSDQKTTVGGFFATIPERNVSELPDLLRKGVASCHAVTTLNDQLIGNPVDIEMFKATGWTLQPSESEEYLDTVVGPDMETVHIVKRFDFVHARASMSVAVLDPLTGHLHIFVKGSFEKVKELSCPDTIPEDYDQVTAQLAREGCYVLAMAHRDLGVVEPETLQRWTREDMESGVSLIGLVLFKNNLKVDTADAIAELKHGSTRTVMITGDTALTGVYISRACGMSPPDNRILLGDVTRENALVWTDVDTDEVVDLNNALLRSKNGEKMDVELAVTGKAFQTLISNDTIRQYLLDIRIFARMTPQDKVDCVKLHMERGITAMCGDGGNDCGALRAAHVGIALSEAEASIVSPFSTNVRSIFSCVELLRQGRAALATSFAEYKYLIMYGQTMAMLKFFTFYFSISISQAVWIFVDTFITVFLAIAIALSGPAKRLAPERPTARLLGPQTLLSTAGLVVIDMLFIAFGFVMLYGQSWFRCNEFDAQDVDISKWWLIADNYESEVLSFIMLFQFVNNAAVYNFGYLFRRSWWRNYSLVVVWAVFVALVSYMELADPNWLGCQFRYNCGTADVLVDLGYPRPSFDIEPYNIDQGHNVMPRDFRWKLWGYSMANMAAGVLWEKMVVLGPIRKVTQRWFPLERLKLEV